MIRIALAAMSIALAAGSVAIGQVQLESAISGSVQSIDRQARTVTLDGKMYSLSDRADMTALQEGSKINLTCDTKRANCMIVTAGSQDEANPESTIQPSAGSDTNDLPANNSEYDSTRSKGTQNGESN